MPDFIGPSGFIFVRVLGALPLFWLIKLFVHEKVAKVDLIRLAVCGLFGVTINQLLFFNGLNLTSPVNASIIMTSTPVLVLIVANILIRERITSTKLIGVLLGTAGAVSLILNSTGGDTGLSDWRGDILVLFNAMSYGIYLVIVKPLMKKYNPTTVISWVFLFGFCFMSPFGWSQFSEIDWQNMPGEILTGVFYVVIGTTFLAYLLNIFALSLVSPTLSASYIYVQPVMVMAITWLVSLFWPQHALHDPINIVKIGSTLLIFLGVYFVSKPAKLRT